MVTILPRRLTIPRTSSGAYRTGVNRTQPDHFLNLGGVQGAQRVAHEKGRQQNRLPALSRQCLCHHLLPDSDLEPLYGGLQLFGHPG